MDQAVTSRTKRAWLAVGLGTIVVAGMIGLGVGAFAYRGHGADNGWGREAAALGRGGRGVERLCAAGHGDSLESLIGFTEHFFSFTPEQHQAWSALAGALRAGHASLQAACRDQGTGPQGSTPERLARLEALVTAGLAVLRDVRPAFDRFYALLTPAQQRALDERLARRHRHG